MATLTISYGTDERERNWWNGRNLDHILPRLGEVVRFVGDIYQAIHDRGLDFAAATVHIRDGYGWVGSGGNLSRDVDFVIEAPKELLVALVSCSEFRDDFLDGLTVDEALAEIAEETAYAG